MRLLAITPPRGLAGYDELDPGLVDAWVEAGAATLGLAVLLREPGAGPRQILEDPRLLPLRRALARHEIPALLSVDPAAGSASMIAAADPPLAGVQLRADPSLETCRSWRAALGPGATIGRSVHGPTPGLPDPSVDYTCLAPIYAPNTRLPGEAKRPIGLDGLRAWAATCDELIALGGIAADNAAACLAAGASGVAGIRLFFGRMAPTQDNVAALCQVFASRGPARADGSDVSQAQARRRR
ncbi:thiamine-phosphate pyrophosphorylase [Enhygromyxa salina]|uniref:Thiamine-phosphate pyrophosphorylase n=1 Tax=Enhygromyxa salina TaxID=215803 RepID=A0A2S9XLR0_9BACT|nr:thiamine phosphate synthase [Enhygromyxa salina]PRP93809.1 thiamine-phosphate pyrophosphorylase [Enhygromyxa salina]